MFLSRTRSGRLRLHAENSINSVGRRPGRAARPPRDPLDDERAAGDLPPRRRQAAAEHGRAARLQGDPGPVPLLEVHPRGAVRALEARQGAGGGRSASRWGRRCRTACATCSTATRSSPRSPRQFHYPACNQDFGHQRVTLGTSVGWSDVYPSTYHEQWINVNGLRGCFAYVHVADPEERDLRVERGQQRGRRRSSACRGTGPAARGCPRESKPVDDAPTADPTPRSRSAALDCPPGRGKQGHRRGRPGGRLHSLVEARGWIEARVDDVYGSRVGKVVDVYFDPDGQDVHWMLVRVRRERRAADARARPLLDREPRRTSGSRSRRT